MNTNHKSNRWTEKQLENILNTEHIRQHLMRVGLINARGEILSKEDYEQQQHLPRRSRRPRSKRRHSHEKNLDNERKHQTSNRRSSNTRTPVQFSRRPEQYRRSKTPDSCLLDRRQATARQWPKRPSRNLISPDQSTRLHSSLHRRSVSPQILMIYDRCLVTMIYYGTASANEAKRHGSEVKRDAVMVMQQHCGGENLIVFKGALLPQEKFQFESRRHPDYPFALAFYINGLIDNRLSVCCEWRYRKNVRLGGRGGLFRILQVINAKACQRCRLERRMHRLTLAKGKQTLRPARPSSPEPPLSRSSTPEDRCLFSPGSPIESEDLHDTNHLVKTHPSLADEPNDRLSCTSFHNDELKSMLIANTQVMLVGNGRRRSLVSSATGDEILLVSDQSTNDLEEQLSKTDDQ